MMTTQYGWGGLLLCGIVTVLSGITVVVLRRKHLVITLMGLEFLVLGVFVILVAVIGSGLNLLLSPLVFLTFSVCEGSLGLSILISMVRAHGNDYFLGYRVL